MKTLKKNYQLFILLNICPPDNTISDRMKLFNRFVSILCPTMVCMAYVVSAGFVAQAFLTDLTNTICAIFQISELTASLYTFLMAHINRKNITEMFNNFETFYNTSKFKAHLNLNHLNCLCTLSVHCHRSR